MDFYDFLAIFAGILVVINTFPQLIKVLRTKKVDDLSILMFLLLFFAQAIWLFYAIHIKNFPVLLTNGGSLIVVGINILLILKYRKIPVKG